MTTIDPTAVDAILRGALRERAADVGDEASFERGVIATAAALPQRRALLRWPVAATRRTGLVLVAALLGTALVAAAVGALGPKPSTVPIKHGNGPILVTHEGTSWWMDPATGERMGAGFPDLPIGVQDAVWSVDGERLAIVVAGDLELVDLISGRRRVLATCADIGWICGMDELQPACNGICWFERTPALAWSPDGTAIAIAEASGVLAVDVSSGEVTVLLDRTPGDERAPILNGPAWSPDGEWIAYVSIDTDLAELGAMQQLHIVRRNGSDRHRLSIPVPASPLGLRNPMWPVGGPGLIVPTSAETGEFEGPATASLGFEAFSIADGDIVGPAVKLAGSGLVPCPICLKMTLAPDGFTVLLDDGEHLSFADLRKSGIRQLAGVNARPLAWRPEP